MSSSTPNKPKSNKDEDPWGFDRWERQMREKERTLPLFSKRPHGPFPNFDPTKIVIPNVPPKEEDPRVRINVMIETFNIGLALGQVNAGLLHEIHTATFLVYAGAIYSGKQISRDLTKAEKNAGLNGESQKIMVPIKDKLRREIDMLCEAQDKIYIVEAKDTKTTDAHQLKANVKLAKDINGGVMYFHRGDSMGQQKALETAFAGLGDAKGLPPLEIIHLYDLLPGLDERGPSHLKPLLITQDDESRRHALELAFGSKISFDDVSDYERDLAKLEKILGSHIDKSEKTIGWAARALGFETKASTLVSGKPIWALAFAADKKTIASSSSGGPVQLWDPRAPLTALQALKGSSDSVTAIAYSADNTMLALATPDGAIQLWDVQKSKSKLKLPKSGSKVTAFAFSHDVSTLASAYRDGTIQLWNVKTGEYLQSYRGFEGQIGALVFSLDNTLTAATFDGAAARLWNAKTGKEIQRLQGYKSTAKSMAFSADGKTLAIDSARNEIQLWDANTGIYHHSVSGHRASVTAIAFSPDGAILATAADDKSFSIWDVRVNLYRE